MAESTWDTPQQHPLLAFASALEELLDDAATANAWSLTPGEQAELLPRLTRAGARLRSVELAVVAQADHNRVGDATGATSTGVWWANATRQTRPAAARLVRLAHALEDQAHEATATALQGGRLLVEQAQVVLDSVQALPSDIVREETIAAAERHLVALAADHDAKELKRLGDRILEVVAPDVAEDHERRTLEAQERRAREIVRFTLSDDGHGACHGRFTVPTAQGKMLLKHLKALAAPKHQAACSQTETLAGARTGDAITSPGPAADTGKCQKVSQPLRLGQAFVEYIEAKSDTPKAGGTAATVVVTMTLEQLLGAETAATLDTGDRITAGEARRLACQAGIIPAVLGGSSQVLDLGRTRRFHTEPQRLAIALRDKGCTAEGCDWPPAMCHVHHPHPWIRGGGTSVENGRLFCPRHHTLVHDARYLLATNKAGKATFHRRT